MLKQTKKKFSFKNKDSDVTKLNLVIKGYKIEEDSSGRGVCLIYKDNLEVTRVPNLEKVYKPCIFAKVSSNKNNYIHIVERGPAGKTLPPPL